jgi:hypothetical protein
MSSADYEAFRAHWRLMGNAPSTAATYLACVQRLTIPLDQVTRGDLMTHLGERAETAYPWFLRTALTEVIGDGKLGKSLVLLSEAARLSHDHKVGIVAAEDAVESVIRPRLRAAGANLDNIYFIDGLPIADGTAMIWLRLPGHVAPLEEWVKATGVVALRAWTSTWTCSTRRTLGRYSRR